MIVCNCIYILRYVIIHKINIKYIKYKINIICIYKSVCPELRNTVDKQKLDGLGYIIESKIGAKISK